jgi:hypothetical protein
MQTRKLLIAGALVAATIAMAAQDGITLRKTLVQGTESYHMESTSKLTLTVPSLGEQELGSKSVTSFVYKIGTVDAAAGQAPVEITTKIEKIDFDGDLAASLAGQKEQLLVATTITGKLDSRSNFIGDPKQKIDPRTVILGSSSASIVGPLVQFPDKAVNAGDAWDVTIPKGPGLNPDDQKITAKFVEEKTIDGKSVCVISLTGALKSNINVGELLKANPVPELEQIGATDMTIKGTIDISGEATVDKVTGQTLTMDLNLKTKQEMAVAALGDAKVPVVGTMTVKYTLDK